MVQIQVSSETTYLIVVFETVFARYCIIGVGATRNYGVSDVVHFATGVSHHTESRNDGEKNVSEGCYSYC